MLDLKITPDMEQVMKPGRCFDAALAISRACGADIVHGTPVLRSNGLRFAHAWNEIDIAGTRMVLDGTICQGGRPMTLTAQRFYEIGRILPATNKTVKAADVESTILEFGHRGPWVPSEEHENHELLRQWQSRIHHATINLFDSVRGNREWISRGPINAYIRAGMTSIGTWRVPALCLSSITIAESHQRQGLCRAIMTDMLTLAKTNEVVFYVENVITPEMHNCIQSNFVNEVVDPLADPKSYFIRGRKW